MTVKTQEAPPLTSYAVAVTLSHSGLLFFQRLHPLVFAGGLRIAALKCGLAQLHLLGVPRLKAAVIHPLVDPLTLKAAVGVVAPFLAPCLQQGLVVPRPVLAAKAIARDAAGGEHDVGMMVALVAFRPWGVNGDVGHHAAVDELVLGKLEALESYVDDLKEQRNKAENRAEKAEARVTALLSDQSKKRKGWWPWAK